MAVPGQGDVLVLQSVALFVPEGPVLWEQARHSLTESSHANYLLIAISKQAYSGAHYFLIDHKVNLRIECLRFLEQI